MRHNPDELLVEKCLYTLAVYSKVNGEDIETKFHVATRLCSVALCNEFKRHLIKKLKEDGVYEYYDEPRIFVSDRKAL